MGRSTELRVARVLISPQTNAKINSKHGLTSDDVRDAVINVRNLPYWWDDDPQRGRRALVLVTIRNRRTVIVLRPNSDPMGDVFDLVTAYPVP